LGRLFGNGSDRWSRRLSPILIVAIVAGLVVPLSAGLQLARPLRAHAASSYSSIVLGDGPAAYWRLGETSGTTMTDSGPNANNGTYTGGYTLGQPGSLSGDSDTAVLFNGSSGYGLAPNSTSLSITGQLTLEAWIKLNSTAGLQHILNKGDGLNVSNSAWELGYAASVPGFYFGTFIGDNNYAAYATKVSLVTGQWYHVVGTRTAGGALAIYVNGTLAATGTDTGAPTNNVPPGVAVSASGDGSGREPFNGTIDEAAVYSVALTATQVSNHYYAGALVGGPYTAAQSAGGGHNACMVCLGRRIRRGNMTSFPIDTNTGNFWHVFTDLSIPGRSYPLAFTRTYNSQSAATNSPVGYGWQVNHAMSLSQSGSTATITQENGSQATFTQSGSTWAPSAPRFIATLTHNGDGTWTFVRANRDTYTFNTAGQLVSEKDLNGYVTTLSYTGGNLTSVADPAGRTLSLGWTGSSITTVTDANVTPSRSVQFQYNDGAGDLTDVIDVNAGHWQFGYDTSHRMTVMKDPKCFATTGCPGVQNSYDTSGRVQSQKDQLNRQTTFTYSTNQTTVTDPKGNQQVDFYNSGLRVAMTKGYGTAQAATWSYAYDTTTMALVAVTDPNGNRTSYTVDGSGNPLTVTDPLGRQTTNTYNGFNQLLTSRDPNTVTTTYTYNGNGNLTSVSRPLTGTSQIQTATYNYGDTSHPGDLTSMVDPDSKTWTYTYDAYGNRASVTDPVSDKSTSVYNGDGWMTSSVSPKGNVPHCNCASQYTTTYAHDSFGDLTTVTDPLSHQTIRHYDADQNLDSLTDGDTNKTTYLYDLANQQTQVQRPDTTTLTTDYNLDGTVQDQKDGKNKALLTYGYDPLARVTAVTDALGNATSYSYDGAGNRLTQQDPGGNCSATPKTGCTTFTYDVANQLKTITYSDGVTPNVTNIAYDNDAQRTGMTDGTGTSAWVWDSLHRLTSYTNGAGAQVQYAYNLRSLPTTITYPGSLNVTRGYDDVGRLTSVQDWLSSTTSFGYDANSNLTIETLPTASGVVDTFAFDAADRLTAISDKKGKTTLFAATYTRDSANQLTSDSSAPTSTSSYKYTTLNQVCYAGSSNSSACSSPPSGATAYAYDAADNLTQMGTTQQAFNNADELCWTAVTSGSCASPPTGATTYVYDARGNRITVTPPSGGATSLSYDQANRLTAYGSIATYAYTGDGLRMSKTVSGTTSQFLWDVASAVPLLLKDGSMAYVYGPGGLPLEQINGSAVLWLHHDQLGSTRLVTDSTGASQATYTFDAYGKLTASTGSITNPLRFAGQYWDGESNLYYLRARYYDPSTGQFLSRDPAVATTREPYTYVDDNPLNGVDPSGLLCWQFWDASKCNNPLTSRTGTVGVCGDFSFTYVVGGVKVEGCGVVRLDRGAPVGVGVTGTGGLGAGVGVGGGATINFQVSNAQQISSLGKGFTYVSAAVGAGPSGAAGLAAGIDDCNRLVGVAEAGVGPGAGVSGQVGESWTYYKTFLGS
jgi:RHS repeat-associated protein